MITADFGIACIGAGNWGKNLVRSFSDLGALRVVCEADRERRTQLLAQYPDVKATDSLDACLADPSVAGVVIATPAETHGQLVRRALLAGKDVLVEKPLCLSAAEGNELVGLASATGRILMVGHLLWYHPAVLKLKELVDGGELGRIQYLYSNRLNLGKIRREENILWSFAPHDISVILGLVGEMPEVSFAQGGNYLHDRIADVTVSALSFPCGVKAHIFVSWLHPFKEQKLVVVGDRRMAVFNDIEQDEKLLLYPHTIDWRNGLPVPTPADAVAVPFDRIEPLKAESLHFLDCIRSRATPRTDGAEGLRVLTVLEACQQQLTTPHRIERELEQLPYTVHPSTFVDQGVTVGEGTTIWHFSHILKNSRIGRQCRIGQNVVVGPNVQIGDGVKIQNNVSVYEGVTLEDEVFCGPSMVFTNVYNPRSGIPRMNEIQPTLVKRGASLGANCTIVCGLTIGQFAFVGAGAVVVKDVPDFALVVGNPGRVMGWICLCGNRIQFGSDSQDGACHACGRAYRKEGDSVSPEESIQ
jgi:UDP-2-acetamido-3-amino-2,3-dideoxy-glucuronate N-acetyltransferase